MAGCGGPSAPNQTEIAEITHAQNTLRSYCGKRVSDPEAARNLGASHEVEILIAEFHEYPEGTFELVSGEEPTTMREVLSGQAAQLGELSCDPRLARRIDEALGAPR